MNEVANPSYSTVDVSEQSFQYDVLYQMIKLLQNNV